MLGVLTICGCTKLHVRNYSDSLVVTIMKKTQYTFHTAITLQFHILEKHYLHRILIFLLSSIIIHNFQTPDKMLTVCPPNQNFVHLPCGSYQLHEIENHGFGDASNGIQRS